MLQTRSNVYLVAQVNTVAGGSIVSITNSAGWIVAQSNTAGMTVNVINTAGWIVNQANTGGNVNVANSAGWVVNVSSTILNSAGWVVAQSNTAGITASIINSAGWVVAASSTLMNSNNLVGIIETGRMSSNGVMLTAGYAVINASGTNNTLVAAIATRKIRVLAYNMISQVGVNAQFQSGTGASNLLTGVYFISSNGGLVAPYCPVGWFESSGNSLLNLKLSAAQSIGGCMTYLEI